VCNPVSSVSQPLQHAMGYNTRSYQHTDRPLYTTINIFTRSQKLEPPYWCSMTDMVKPGIYKHYKGGTVQVLYNALDEPTLEPVVVYEALYECRTAGFGSIWVRTQENFNGWTLQNGRMVKRFVHQGGWRNWVKNWATILRAKIRRKNFFSGAADRRRV